MGGNASNWRNRLLLILLPLGLLLINAAWAYTSDGIDAWYYYGHFFNWMDYIQIHPDDYISSRLGYILPGYLIHQALPPIAANYVLSYITYAMGVVALYEVVKKRLSQQTALMTAVFMGLYVPYATAQGWFYVDGYIVSLTLIVLLCLHGTKHSRWWMLGAGLAFGLAVHSNMFALAFAIPLIYYGYTLRRSWQALLLDGLVALIGFSLLTLLLCLINLAAGGRFLFFMASVDFSTQSMTALNFISRGNWLIQADHLVLPALVLLSCIRRKPDVFQVHYLIWFVLFIIVEVLGQYVFPSRYYMTYLIPALFLAFASFIDPIVQRLSVRANWLILIGTAISLILPFASSVWREMALEASTWEIPVLVSLIVLVPAFVLIYSQRRFALIVLAISLSVVGYRAIINDTWIDTSYFNPVNNLEDRHDDLLMASYDTIQIVREIVPDNRAYMWMRVRPFEDYRFERSIANTYMRSMFGDYPNIGNFWDAITYHPDMVVVLLAFEEGMLEDAQQILDTEGFEGTIIASRSVDRGRYHFDLHFIQIDSYPT